MAVQFIIDSASDILPEEAKQLGIAAHLPLKVLFGEEEYTDAVTLSHDEFYRKLAASEALPTTSQVPPAAFEAAYEDIIAAGDTAVVVTMSGKLSGTYQSAVIAAEDYEGKIFVVDSLNATIGERILILRGLQLRDQGLSAAEIAAKLDEEKTKIRLLAMVDTLEYLKKGGRISAATALAGSLLNIKPIIAVEDGLVTMKSKARGAKQALNLLRELIPSYGQVQFDKPYAFTYSGLSEESAKKFAADNADLWPDTPETLGIHSVGCSIGTHVGPGAVGIAYFAE